MEDRPVYDPPNPMNQPPGGMPGHDQSGDNKAIAGLVLGALSLLCWCVPLIGIFVAVPGLVLGIMGLQSENRGFAIAAIILSAIGLVLTLANGIIGAYMGMTGQHDLVNQLGLIMI